MVVQASARRSVYEYTIIRQCLMVTLSLAAERSQQPSHQWKVGLHLLYVVPRKLVLIPATPTNGISAVRSDRERINRKIVRTVLCCSEYRNYNKHTRKSTSSKWTSYCRCNCFLLSLYLVFKLLLILCVLFIYACFCWLCGM